MRRVRNVNGSVSLGVQSSKPNNELTGILNKEELEAGHGMFMGVTLSKRKQQSNEESNSPNQVSSLFSDVISKRLLSNNSNSSHHGVKRTFSNVISRRQSLTSAGGSAITVSAQQFVFIEDTTRNTNSILGKL